LPHASRAAHPQKRQLRLLQGRPHDVHRPGRARQAAQRHRRVYQRELLRKMNLRRRTPDGVRELAPAFLRRSLLRRSCSFSPPPPAGGLPMARRFFVRANRNSFHSGGTVSRLHAVALSLFLLAALPVPAQALYLSALYTHLPMPETITAL